MANDWGLIVAAAIGATPATIAGILAWVTAGRAHRAAATAAGAATSAKDAATADRAATAENTAAIAETSTKLDGLHIIINSRLSELLEQTRLAEHAAGMVAGRAEEHDEQEQRMKEGS